VLRLAAASFLLAGSAVLAASAPVQPEVVPLDLQLQQARGEAAAAEAEQRRLESAAAKAQDEVSRLRARQLAAAQAIAAAEAQISAADARARLVHSQLVGQRQHLAREQAPVSSLLTGLALMARRPPVLLLAGSGSAGGSREASAADRGDKSGHPGQDRRPHPRAREGEPARAGRAWRARRDGSDPDGTVRRRDAFARLEARAIQLAETRGSEALGAGDVALARQEQLSDNPEAVEIGALERATGEAACTAWAGPAAGKRGGGRVSGPASISFAGGRRRHRRPGSGQRQRRPLARDHLATRRGTALIVPASGTILFAGPFRDYDGVVIIDHGRGWKSVLVNAGSRLSRGARVEIGEPLGIAFGTGGSSAPARRRAGFASPHRRFIWNAVK
jgi:murein hydrolase activator